MSDYGASSSTNLNTIIYDGAMNLGGILGLESLQTSGLRKEKCLPNHQRKGFWLCWGIY